MDNKYYIGIDIAKAKFDMAFFEENDKKTHKVFDNTKKGFVEMNQFLKEKGIKEAHFTMEATNVYWRDLTEYLHKKKDFTQHLQLKLLGLSLVSLIRCKLQPMLSARCSEGKPTKWTHCC